MVDRVEAAIQRAYCAWVKEHYPHVKLMAAQNENSRHAVDLGMDVGQPDVPHMWNCNGVIHLWFLELKTTKGRLKPSQIAWNQDFDANFKTPHCIRSVAYGFEEAKALATLALSNP